MNWSTLATTHSVFFDSDFSEQSRKQNDAQIANKKSYFPSHLQVSQRYLTEDQKPLNVRRAEQCFHGNRPDAQRSMGVFSQIEAERLKQGE